MDHLKLRRLQQSDSKRIAELANNKRIWDHLRDYLPHPYEVGDAVAFIEMTNQENPKQTFGIELGDGTICGVIGLVVQQDVYFSCLYFFH